MKYLYSIFSDPLTRTAVMKFASGPDSLAQRCLLPESDVILSAVSNRATIIEQSLIDCCSGHYEYLSTVHMDISARL